MTEEQLLHRPMSDKDRRNAILIEIAELRGNPNQNVSRRTELEQQLGDLDRKLSLQQTS